MNINDLILQLKQAKEFYKDNKVILDCLLELEEAIKKEEVRP